MKSATIVVRALAFGAALAAARYFLVPPPLLDPIITFDSPTGEAGARVAPNLYRRYPVVFLAHVGGGVVALVIGLFQFMTRIRTRRPAVHRALGFAYLVAVFVGAVSGLPLSLLILRVVPDLLRSDFFPMAGSFFALAIAWAFVSAVALQGARRRDFRQHRAWMIRSYALTFAAVTVRLVSGLLFAATGDVILAVNCGVLSWPLNLITAEWLIRRDPGAAFAGAVA